MIWMGHDEGGHFIEEELNSLDTSSHYYVQQLATQSLELYYPKTTTSMPIFYSTYSSLSHALTLFSMMSSFPFSAVPCCRS